jgi:uncharacterized protein (TIGR03118 family)
MVRISTARWQFPVAAAAAGLVLGAAALPSTASATTTSATSASTASASTASSTTSASTAGGSGHGHHDGDDNRFTQVNLVADTAGVAALTDPHLVNAWGLSQGPTTPVWVSDNGTDLTTLYTGAGQGQTPAIAPLVVTIPGGAPTGQAFNPTTSFVLANASPARFVFAGEDGDISAWNPQLTPPTSAVHVASVPGGVLKGLALVQTRSHGPEILVADFVHRRIVAFDGTFQPVKLPRWAFTDRRIPRGYGPFNVAVLGSRVFVTYAKIDPKTGDDVKGPGRGFVDVYSTGGRLLHRFARRGVLNSPWGLAIAPAHFGAFSGDVLVGNFGDGRIHAFDPWTGHLRGTLRNDRGRPISIDGLWALLPGNGTSAGTDDVWFSAGPQDESHGLLGVLRASPDADDR